MEKKYTAEEYALFENWIKSNGYRESQMPSKKGKYCKMPKAGHWIFYFTKQQLLELWEKEKEGKG